MMRFESLLEAVPDALVGMDQKGMIRFVNRQTEQLFDYDRKNLIGTSIEALLPEPLWQIYAAHRENYFADSRTRSSGLDLELTGRHRDGTQFPVNISMANIDTGDVLLVVTAVYDVAKQRRAVKQAGLIAAVVEYSEDAIIAATLDGIITSWNPGAERMYGYSSEEIIGRSATVLAEPDEVPEVLTRMAQVKEGRHLKTFESTRVRKDGSVLPVSVTVGPIRDADGEIAGLCAIHRDVTEQRRAFEVAQHMAAIVENSDDAIIGRTLEGTITSWNLAAERMYGYTSQEITGKSMNILIPEDRREEIEGILARIRAGQPVERLETVRVRKNGGLIPVSLTLSAIRDVDGAIVGISAIHRDVTETRRAFEVAQGMQAIVQNSDDPIFSMTLEGIITSWNPAAQRLYGYPGAEIIGQPVSILKPNNRRDDKKRIPAGIRVGEHAEHLETISVRRDGTRVPISATLSPIRDANGEIVGISAIHRDVTEQRQAYEVAQRMEAIVEGSEDAIIGQTLKGVVKSWNPAAQRMYGYSAEEIIGKSIGILLPEDQVSQLFANLASIKDGKQVDHLETARVRKDGSVFPASVSMSPIHDKNGKVVGISSIHRDVTEQRQAYGVAQRMEAIVESSDDAIVGQTLQGVVTSWNPAAQRMYGYSAEEIIGQPISHLMPEDRRNEVESILTRIRAGQHVERLDTIRLREDGTRFPLSLTISPILDPDGAIIGASGIGRDMSEQEHLAQYARSLIEASQDPMITIGPDGRINDVNEATVKITGIARDELIGSWCEQYMAEPDKGRAYIQKAFEQGSATNVAQTVRHRDGTLTDVLCNATVYRDAGGNVLGVLSTGHDVTHQKEAFEAAQRMAAIVQNSDDAIISGTLEGIITSWNPAAERMYGFSAEEIIGQPARLLLPAQVANVVQDVLAKIKAGQQVVHVETKRRRKDGAVFPISVTTSAIRDAGGTIVGVCAIARDMAESEHAAEYARSLLEAAMDPLVTISPEGKINDVNEATVKVTGVPRQRLVGTDFAGYFSDPDKAHEGYQRVFAQGSVTDYPLTLRHQDGTLTDVLYNASVYRDSGGNVLGVLAVARDMTNQRKAFEAAQRMSAIVEYSDDAIIGVTLDGTITSWNPAAERLYGYSSDRIAGRSVDLLSPEDRAGQIKAVLARISEGRPVSNFETICTRKDRTIFPVKLTIAPIRNAHGAVVGASAIARDVTQQRRALLASQQMGAIVRGSDDAIISRTLEGTITSWNPAAERMFGYPAEEIIGRPIELLTPPDRAGEASTVQANITKGQPVEHLETNRIRQDGTVFPVSLTVSPIRDEVGAVSGAYVIARDMTEPT